MARTCLNVSLEGKGRIVVLLAVIYSSHVVMLKWRGGARNAGRFPQVLTPRQAPALEKLGIDHTAALPFNPSQSKKVPSLNIRLTSSQSEKETRRFMSPPLPMSAPGPAWCMSCSLISRVVRFTGFNVSHRRWSDTLAFSCLN